MNYKINGNKFTVEQVIETLIKCSHDATKRDAEFARIAAVQVRRNRITAAVVARDAELAGKSPEIYRMVREKIVAEETKKINALIKKESA